MSLSEVVRERVEFINGHLFTKKSDPEMIGEYIRSGSTIYAPANYLKQIEGRQPRISERVGPYDVTLIHPKRADSSYIGINSHRKVSDLRFHIEGEEGGIITPSKLGLCVSLAHYSTYRLASTNLSYVISKEGTVFAVSPPERQSIDFDSAANVVFVNRAQYKESLAVVGIAKRAVHASEQVHKKNLKARRSAGIMQLYDGY